MITTSNVLRYWYLWMTAVVLASAAATSFRHGMTIELFGFSFGMRVWQFIAGCVVFLVAVGGVHIWLDGWRRPFAPRWVKSAQLVFSVAFCVLAFVYLQILDNRRMSDPRSYFGVEGVRYYEDADWFTIVFVAAFLLSQFLFLLYLLLRLRPKRPSHRRN